MTTIASAISRVKIILKAVKQDPLITDRFVYAELMVYAKKLIKMEDDKNKLMRMSSLFRKAPCIEMIDSSPIEACCLDIDTGCTIKRSKERLPNIMQGVYGPLIRMVGSLDFSQEIILTDPAIYASMQNTTTWKYNKNNYGWIIDGYLYAPGLDWEAIALDALFEDDFANLNCCSDEYKCIPRQEQPIPIPDYMLADIGEMIKRDLGFTAQLPGDQATDKTNVLR
jgi:hypothetical protein